MYQFLHFLSNFGFDFCNFYSLHENGPYISCWTGPYIVYYQDISSLGTKPLIVTTKATEKI